MNLREKKNSCAGWVQGGELFMSCDCGVAVYPEIVPRVSVSCLAFFSAQPQGILQTQSLDVLYLEEDPLLTQPSVFPCTLVSPPTGVQGVSRSWSSLTLWVTYFSGQSFGASSAIPPRSFLMGSQGNPRPYVLKSEPYFFPWIFLNSKWKLPPTTWIAPD